MTDGSTTAEADIRQVIDEWAAAIRAKDVEQVTRHYVPDLVFFSLAPPLKYEGMDAAGLAKWFATWEGPLEYSLHELRIHIGGDLALCHSLNWLGGTKVGGKENGLWFRHTLGLRLIHSQWKIVHEHESVPFYMDGSDRAAIDLTPATQG